MFTGGHILLLGIAMLLAVLIVAASLLIVLARRSRPLWPLLVDGLLVGLLGLGFSPSVTALPDLLHPAHVQGIVTDRQLTVTESPTTGGSDNVSDYVITVGRHAFHVSDEAYGIARVGTCIAVTYGPDSGYVFDVHGCGDH